MSPPDQPPPVRTYRDRAGMRFDYDVCFSFAGEQRHYVGKTAELLRSMGVRVFYDEYEKVNLWGKDYYDHLQMIYQEKAKYCVIFISKDYASKVWTNHERKSAQARALHEKVEYVLPARFDDTELPGILPSIGYIDLRQIGPTELAELIVEKIGQPSDPDSAREPGQARTPPVPRSSKGWWRTMTRSEVIIAAVITGIFAVIAAVIALNPFSSDRGTNRPPIVAASSSSTPGNSITAQSSSTGGLISCPSEKASWYKQPTSLPGLATTSLVFCAVDVNNGQPIIDRLHVSGIIRGRVPHGDVIVLISWQDPSTCSVDGTPGTGQYFYQTQIDPTPSNGYWQFTTADPGQGNQTIRRYIYFALAPPSEIPQLKLDSTALPNDVLELAYITSQGVIPANHHCK